LIQEQSKKISENLCKAIVIEGFYGVLNGSKYASFLSRTGKKNTSKKGMKFVSKYEGHIKVNKGRKLFHPLSFNDCPALIRTTICRSRVTKRLNLQGA
jgi:hypothetical protein